MWHEEQLRPERGPVPGDEQGCGWALLLSSIPGAPTPGGGGNGLRVMGRRGRVGTGGWQGWFKPSHQLPGLVQPCSNRGTGDATLRLRKTRRRAVKPGSISGHSILGFSFAGSGVSKKVVRVRLVLGPQCYDVPPHPPGLIGDLGEMLLVGPCISQPPSPVGRSLLNRESCQNCALLELKWQPVRQFGFVFSSSTPHKGPRLR